MPGAELAKARPDLAGLDDAHCLTPGFQAAESSAVMRGGGETILRGGDHRLHQCGDRLIHGFEGVVEDDRCMLGGRLLRRLEQNVPGAAKQAGARRKPATGIE